MSARILGVGALAILVSGTDARAAPPGCSDCECASREPEMAVLKSFPARDWRERFAAAGLVRSAGDYAGSEPWTFESFSLEKNQPSATTRVRIDRGRLDIADAEPGLKKNPAAPPPWAPGAGAVSLTGWVNARFSDVAVRGVVNAARAPAQSRQGLLARWDRHHKYYWLYIDFATGKLVIAKQTPGTAAALPLPGGERAIPGFRAGSAYTLEFDVVGKRLRGRARDPGGAVVAELGPLEDAEALVCGIAGVNAELSLAAPFAPLAASFGDVSAGALRPAR